MDQGTLKYLLELEKFIISSVSDYNPEINAELLSERFPKLRRDIDFQRLVYELCLLPSSFKEHFPDIKEITSIDTVLDCMNRLDIKNTFSQFHLIDDSSHLSNCPNVKCDS